MRTDLWIRLEPVLDEALDLDPRGRGLLLRRVRGDDAELGAQLQKLVEECDDADGFLDAARPAAQEACRLHQQALHLQTVRQGLASTYEAERLSPRYPLVWHGRGVLLLRLARWQAARGLDPWPRAREAVAALNKALELAPTRYEPFFTSLVEAHLFLATLALNDGRDPDPELEKARGVIEEGGPWCRPPGVSRSSRLS